MYIEIAESSINSVMLLTPARSFVRGPTGISARQDTTSSKASHLGHPGKEMSALWLPPLSPFYQGNDITQQTTVPVSRAVPILLNGS